jgi:hypothetical protein
MDGGFSFLSFSTYIRETMRIIIIIEVSNVKEWKDENPGFGG